MGKVWESIRGEDQTRPLSQRTTLVITWSGLPSAMRSDQSNAGQLAPMSRYRAPCHPGEGVAALLDAHAAFPCSLPAAPLQTPRQHLEPGN